MAPILSDAALRSCVRALAPAIADAAMDRIFFVPARTASRLDLSTDAALAAAGAAGLAGVAFASLLAKRLELLPGVGEVRIEGPGFINIRLLDSALDGILPAVLALPAGGSEPSPMTIPLAAMRLSDPHFAVQHAHARCRSVLRAASLLWGPEIRNRAALAHAARGAFASGPARVLLCRLEHWLRLGEAPGRPHNSTHTWLFLRDLSDRFDRLWKASHDDATLRFLYPDQPHRSLANLALVVATAETIRSGLALLGTGAAEELR